MKLSFLGGAGEVTGSCYLVTTGAVRFLVDCGMFQGGAETRAKNRAGFAFDPRQLDFVLITHAHIDHSGLLPRLTAAGYRGSVYTTAATCDLLEVMLLDSAFIHEREAERGRNGRSNRKPSRRRDTRSGNGEPPLYTVAQATKSLKQLRRVEYGQSVQPHAGVRCTFNDAGHIVGAASIEVWVEDGGRTRKLVFSGDIGQPMRPIVRDPTPITTADVLLIESTYGNRLHKSLDDTLVELEHAVVDTLKRKGGNVIIPSFAVGRTQDLLFLLADLYQKDRLPDMDIYVDSPMALKATEVTMRHARLLDRDAQRMLAWLRKGGGQPRINFVQDIEESATLHHANGAVIISASGMCEAGRIKHHLRHNLGRPESTIIFTGFQAAGTLGRRLVDGAKEVKIFGIPVPVRADIYTIGGLSAHADQAGLLGWLKHFQRAPQRTFVVHGEAENAGIFAGAIREQLKWEGVSVPAQGETVDL